MIGTSSAARAPVRSAFIISLISPPLLTFWLTVGYVNRMLCGFLYSFCNSLAVLTNPHFSHKRVKRWTRCYAKFCKLRGVNMALHIGNEQFIKDGVTNCSTLPQV